MMSMVIMHDMHLGGIDLNLLVVLDALLSTRSVTGAAARLHLSQSATSHALARLRAALGDTLLVRSAGGLVPTLRAEQLAAPLAAALAGMAAAIARPQPFEPATAQRSFTIGGADYAELVLLPPLMARLATEAPGVDLVLRSAGGDPVEAVLRGECDVATGPDLSTNDRPGIRARTLFTERFVCLVRRDHPALGKRWTAQRYAALRHAFIAPRGRPGGVVDDALGRLGLRRRVALMIPHFLVAPFVIAQSDLVLTVAERVARAFATALPLAVVAPPLEIPGFSMMLLWHDRVHEDPAQRWLRRVLVEVAGPTATADSPRSASRPAKRGSRRSPSR